MNSFVAILKKTTLTILIVSVTILTFLAVLSIWDVLAKDVSSKAIESMILLGSVSLMFLLAAAVVQKDSQSAHKPLSVGWIILIILGAIFVLPSLFSLFFLGFLSFGD